MLHTYKLLLKSMSADSKFKKCPAKGAIMHGILNCAVKDDFFHKGSMLRPYSQSIVPVNADCYEWKINILSTAKAGSIISWLQSGLSHLHVDRFSEEFQILNMELVKSITYNEFVSNGLACENSSLFSLEIQTPLIFKLAQNKIYHPLPDCRLIFQSLLAKWNAFSSDVKFLDEDVLAELVNSARLSDFSLRSSVVHMDGIKVTGAKGNLTIRLDSAKSVRATGGMLLKFAEFSGVGAKTSMGLGAVVVRSMVPLSERKPRFNSKSNDFARAGLECVLN